MLPEIVVGVPVRETEVNAFIDRINFHQRSLHEYQQMILSRDNLIDEQRKQLHELKKEIKLLKSVNYFFN